MTRILFTSAAAASLLLAACGSDKSAPETSMPDMPAAHEGMPMTDAGTAKMMTKSYAVQNASGNKIGTVQITDTASGVDLNLDVTAIPAGNHAIHFHENGVCDGPDFKTAGGHYNPKSAMHGFDMEAGPHAGDMKNFDAPNSGVVKITIANSRVSLSERAAFAPLFDSNGTALIIHAEADDYKSQPSGAAGARIACAVIGG